MSRPRNREFLHDRGQMPTLWVEGTREQMRPIIDEYGDAFELLADAAAAAKLGLNFRLDFYTAPVSDTIEQQEAHLTVWREIRADVCVNRRRDEPPDP